MSHTFEVTARWKEGLRGEVTPSGVASTVPFAVPREFGGPGGEWTPEHFLATAVGSCVQSTFLAIAGMSKLPVAGYETTASASMEKGSEGFRITEVKLSVSIRVTAEKDVERAQRMIEKAEKLCPISNSLKCPVHVTTTVTL